MKDREKQILLSTPLFLGTGVLSGNETAPPEFTVRDYSPGDVIPSDEEQKPMLAVLLSGKASVTTPDSGRLVLLRFLSPGAVFGIANLFSGEGSVSRIKAEKPSTVFLMSEDAVRTLLEENPVFRENYISFLTDRIRFLNRKIGYLTAGSAERRLALYLSSLGDGKVVLTDSISSLSDLLNLGRASLYRAFDRLEADGYLVRNGRELTLTDRDALLAAYQNKNEEKGE